MSFVTFLFFFCLSVSPLKRLSYFDDGNYLVQLVLSNLGGERSCSGYRAISPGERFGLALREESCGSELSAVLVCNWWHVCLFPFTLVFMGNELDDLN